MAQTVDYIDKKLINNPSVDDFEVKFGSIGLWLRLAAWLLGRNHSGQPPERQQYPGLGFF